MKKMLMVDTGRKFFSKQAMFSIIDTMSQAGFEILHWHFSDNEGFRIESNVCPKMVAVEHLTKDDVREVIAYAQAHHIEIMPEIDSPGHLAPLLAVYPEYKLQSVKDGLSIPNNALNITNPDAVSFFKQILVEFIELFADSQAFHLGADEFIDFDKLDAYPDLMNQAYEQYGEDACGLEVYIQYVNELVELMNQHGKTAHVWSDGFYRLNDTHKVTLDKRAVVHYWTRWNQQMAPIATFIEQGHQVVNCNDNFMYFVLGENAGYQYPTADKIEQGWQPYLFSSNQQVEGAQQAFVKAVELCVWSDKPDALTETMVIERITPLLQTISKKMK